MVKISTISLFLSLFIGGLIIISCEAGEVVTEPDTIEINNYYTNVQITYVTNMTTYISNSPSAGSMTVYYIPTPASPVWSNLYGGTPFFLVTNEILVPIGSTVEVWNYIPTYGWKYGPFVEIGFTISNYFLKYNATNYITNAIVVYQ